MHILLPVGLYDNRGIRYVNDSFGVARCAGLNMTKAGDLPLKWSNELHGLGRATIFQYLLFFSRIFQLKKSMFHRNRKSSPSGRFFSRFKICPKLVAPLFESQKLWFHLSIFRYHPKQKPTNLEIGRTPSRHL